MEKNGSQIHPDPGKGNKKKEGFEKSVPQEGVGFNAWMV